MPDDSSPYRPFAFGPIPADHPMLDAGGFVDLIAAYGPDASRPVAEAGLYAGLMSDDWLLRLAYPNRSGEDDG